MLSTVAFDELMCRVQAGDADAAAELVHEYESDIRLEVRVRLRVQNGRVRRMLDSMDITQSVLASFFAGVAVGRIAPQHPQQLLALLVTMARNKLLTQCATSAVSGATRGAVSRSMRPCTTSPPTAKAPARLSRAASCSASVANA